MRLDLHTICQDSVAYRDLSHSLKEQSAYWRALLRKMKEERLANNLPHQQTAGFVGLADHFAPRQPSDVLQLTASQPIYTFEVTDAQWQRIAALLQPPQGKGRPPANQRQTLNGILYVLRCNAPWRRIPPRYGSYVTCWRRLLRWQNNGTWRQIRAILALPDDAHFPRYR